MKNFLVCLEVKSIPLSVEWYKKVGFRIPKRAKYEATVAYEGADVRLNINPQRKKPGTTKGLTLFLYTKDMKGLYKRLKKNRVRMSSCAFRAPRKKTDPLYKAMTIGKKMPQMNKLVQAGLLDAIGLNDPNGHYWLIQSRETK